MYDNKLTPNFDTYSDLINTLIIIRVYKKKSIRNVSVDTSFKHHVFLRVNIFHVFQIIIYNCFSGKINQFVLIHFVLSL